ncbi:MAG: aminopeptidase P family protein [Rhodobacteraceae bacterium]|nr:aminopeptidase P family protein [Paracoccaceae bacterium]
MFQSFTVSSRPEQGPPRLEALRAEMAKEELDGFLVPRADAHQGEYVADCDARLEWLTGFTGSAGFCAVLADRAGVFVDGRYRVQVKEQVDTGAFTPVNWPEVKLGPWLAEALPDGGRVGFDPWLHTAGEIETLRTAVAGIEVVPCPNLVDRVWTDRPGRPAAPVVKHPTELAGKGDETKRAEIAQLLVEAGQAAVVLTLPDSLCWLLNIRGADIPRIPVVQAFAILRADGRMEIFSDPAKFEGLGPDPDIEVLAWEAFPARLAALDGPVRVDKATAPLAVSRILEESGVEVAWGQDPCLLPKARKTKAEIAGAAAAHLRDGAAMVEFLAWLDAEAPRGGLTEIEVVKKLEEFRRATNALRDISFETICGAGPNGAIVHYRVTEESNRPVRPGEVLLVDSGGQYQDGTTDITRTVAVGEAPEEARAPFTRVLQGMIAISRARWPKGLAGRDLDALARVNLWMAGQDYDHGTGHGVGSYLSVHEGPQRLSRISNVPLEPGMILSNEPGYYREGEFGIRIENLIVVEPAPLLPGGDAREMLSFKTLTHVPIDRRLIDREMLSPAERAWLDAYHAETREKLADRVSDTAREWLFAATAPI